MPAFRSCDLLRYSDILLLTLLLLLLKALLLLLWRRRRLLLLLLLVKRKVEAAVQVVGDRQVEVRTATTRLRSAAQHCPLPCADPGRIWVRRRLAALLPAAVHTCLREHETGA